MQAPFASELTASPDGKSVAWVLFEQGRRNIYVASAPQWTAKKVTSFDTDDGQELSQLAWAPGSAALYFARGGDFETLGEVPNPASSTVKPDQSVWKADLAGKPAVRIAEGNSPVVCGAGGLFLLQKSQVSQVAAGSGSPRAAFYARGSIDSLTCSPDGSALAFVANRQSHSLVGVYRFATKSVTYLQPGIDRDQYPSWSPDSKRIAFVRVATETRELSFGPRRETSEPFSIVVADTESGAGKAIFTADAGPGSVFHAVDADTQLFWTASGEIVFPWEKSGWLSLYAVPSSGGTARVVAQSDAEVEHVAFSPDRTTLYFSTNRGDIDRRHIWKVKAAAGGVAEQVTRGEGIEWLPQPVTSGVAYLASGAREKAHAMVLADSKAKALAPETVSATFPASSLAVPQQVVFPAADGLPIHGQLFLPPGNSPAKKPALLFFHGGSRRQMLLGFHYMYYYSNAYALNQYLASQGYVVLSVNYRSGIGYGLNFREALNYGATGGSEYNDVIGAALFLRSRADVDPARMGLWGGSYGGYLTALGLARASNLFKAGVDFHGVHDWSEIVRASVPPYEPSRAADLERIAFESSPMADVAHWTSPVLLIQGDDDRNVSFRQTIHLLEQLRKQHVETQLLVFPDEVHDFLLYRSWLRAYQATVDFFSERLR